MLLFSDVSWQTHPPLPELHLPFLLHQGPSLTEKDRFLKWMLTAGRRGREENRWASVRPASAFFPWPCSATPCWPVLAVAEGRTLTSSSMLRDTVRGSNMRSGGPLVFWRSDTERLAGREVSSVSRECQGNVTFDPWVQRKPLSSTARSLI